MSEPTATYAIKQTSFTDSARCVCGHTFAAHGSSGKICCQCDCKEFATPETERLEP